MPRFNFLSEGAAVGNALERALMQREAESASA
jgi:hypothetical protein